MITILILVLMSCAGQVADRLEEERIKPYEKNQKYWQYKGKPVMLLGANKTDSPFLLPDQEAYYDELASLGGNYTRYNVKQRLVQDLMPLFPHKKLSDGTYDLNQWDEGYWDRFEQGLILTRDRDIIVQLELWDRFDVGCETHYMSSSWKPSNNTTYTETESGMPDKWEGCDRVVHKHPFYSSIPSLDNNQLILNLQHDFADKVLSISLKYDHVLYVITNETTLDPGWSDYWARYIHDKAKAMKKNVEVSEMPWTIADNFPFDWQQPELGDPDKWINHVFDNTGLYSFCAFQFQPILKSRQDHYDRLAEVYDRVMQSSGGPRPVNAVKIFAREKIIAGKSEPNAQTRFWRPLLAGWAAVSLHRAHPGTGYLGFGEAGKNNLSAARKFCDAIAPWECMPRQDLLLNRESDEAYLLAKPGKAYGVYFPTTGSVDLDMHGNFSSAFTLRWISIETGKIHGNPKKITANEKITLATPDTGSNAGWAATLVIDEEKRSLP